MGKRPFSIPGFIPLAPSIHLQDPNLLIHRHHQHQPQDSGYSSSAGATQTTPPPDLIIITSWTGAIDRHVAKYTASYNSLFPGTPILVITTVVSDLAIRSPKHKIKSLAPAVTYLLTRQLPPSAISHNFLPPLLPTGAGHTPTANPYTGPFFSPTPNPLFAPHAPFLPERNPFSAILLHAFSEGGSFAAVSLARAYLLSSSSSSSSRKIPIAAFIFDSTPGTSTPSLTSAAAAFHRACPTSSSLGGLPKLAGGLLSYAAFRFSSISSSPSSSSSSPPSISSPPTPKSRNWLQQTKQGINDPSLWEIQSVPRTYLFGEKDDLVLWEDVHRHGLESAQTHGVKSLMVRFRRTGHCGHARDDDVASKKLYWAAVKQTWEGREDGGLGIKLGLC